MPELLRGAFLFGAAFLAGAVNAVAGGGTLITFPALLAAGLSPVAANATSTVGLVPGSFSSFWAYRRSVRGQRALLWALLVPSVVGGGLGAWLVNAVGDATFARLVPWLIFGATALFVAQGWLRRRATATDAGALSPARLAAIAAFQLVVAVYGGFFGAGIGILMLAALGLLGLADIHHMNGLKNLASVAINAVASVTFALEGRVDWRLALLMAAGGMAGGYGGAGAAQKLGQQTVRRLVVGIGVAIGLYLLIR